VNNAEALIELSGLTKSYGIGTSVETEVLHGIDFTLQRGEFAALIGPSGSGKSTLLNIVGLLERMTTGAYRLLGQSVADLDDAALTARRGDTLGFVFQFHHLLPAFSAVENVMLPSLVKNGQFTDAVRANAMHLLDRVGLKTAADKKPAQLSGGMQQRVAIARALSRGCPLVLADEPTGNLDTRSADDVFALLRDFNREDGTAFLIVTHDSSLARRCDRIVELIDGRIKPAS
jgi:lipoprotein-releasing system ATP-binding protein